MGRSREESRCRSSRFGPLSTPKRDRNGRRFVEAAPMLTPLPPAVSDEAALAVLPGVVRRWFVRRFGQPTAAQRAAWPALAAGRSLLLSAPTGTGKTLAAMVPLLGELLALPPTLSVRCLYLAPLKALVNDVRRNLRRHVADLAADLGAGAALPRLEQR